MKVILQQDVRGKGKRGQMIEVAEGYGRNYLLPRKLAVEATADNVNTMRMNDKATAERQARERAEALDISKRLKDITVTVACKGGGAGRPFGSVTSQEIATALEAQYGVKVEKRRIEVANIRNAGDFTVSVWLYAGITAEMTARVEVAQG